MLYPQTNAVRRLEDLSGIWEFAADPDDRGEVENWPRGFRPEAVVGVPGSWNEQLTELGLMNYVGPVWYQRTFFCHPQSSHRRLLLRFGSADFHARVWVNGVFCGEHSGGYLPFAFDVTDKIQIGEPNLLVVRVDNALNHDTIPQGLSERDFLAFGKNRDQSFPPTVFDFFAYGGLARPVQLLDMHETHLVDLRLQTRMFGGGQAELDVAGSLFSPPEGVSARLSVLDGGEVLEMAEIPLTGSEFRLTVPVKRIKPWSPASPHLYTLRAELLTSNRLVDRYDLPFGFREIAVEGGQLLLNGEPIFLKGFGRHEDFPVLGKGLSHAVLAKDFALMRWIGANSFRTSHIRKNTSTWRTGSVFW